MVCQNCGYAFSRKSTRTSKRKIYYYRCLGSEGYRYENGRKCDNRPIRQDYLDELVWNHIIELLGNPQLVSQEIDKRVKQAADENPLNRRKEKLTKEHKKLQKSIDKLLDAYQEHLLPLSELRKRMPQLRKRQATLDAELKSLQAKAIYSQHSSEAFHNMENFLRQLKLNADKLSIEDKQKVLRLLVKDIFVGYETIIINHCIKLKGGSVGVKEKSWLLRGEGNFSNHCQYGTGRNARND